MAEPASTSLATAAVAGAGLVALFPGLDGGAVLGAFAGASVFILSSQNLTTARKLAFLVLAILAGIVAGPFATSLIDTALPERVIVSEGVGALVASSIVIKLLIWLIGHADNPGALLAILKKGGTP